MLRGVMVTLVCGVQMTWDMVVCLILLDIKWSANIA